MIRLNQDEVYELAQRVEVIIRRHIPLKAIPGNYTNEEKRKLINYLALEMYETINFSFGELLEVYEE